MAKRFKVQIQPGKFEGLYPVYEPFFKAIEENGATIEGTIITFPDDVSLEIIQKLAKPYANYIQLVPVI